MAQKGGRRFLRRVAIGVLALYAGYLLAANAFLNTRLGTETINRRPERFTAQWRWAMSLYPGHIYARDVLLRGHVRRIEWRVAGGSAHGRIQLLPLLRRQLRFGAIRGGTVDVDVDTGRALMPPTPRRGAARRRKPWELVFEHIRSDQVRHLRLGEWRVDGAGAGDFSFYKQVSGGPMEIAPSQLHMRNATLRQGDTTWAQEAALDLDLALDRHIPARVQGMDKLELARAHLRLAGRAPSLRIVEAADGRLQVQRAGIGGRVEADLGIQHGTLDEGGYLHAVMPLVVQGARAGAQGYGVDARIDVRSNAVALHVHVPPQPRTGNRIDADLLLPGRQLLPKQASRLLDKAQKVIWETTVATGKPRTPTPLGRFYVDVWLPNPGRPYGQFMLSIAGFSEVYKTFEGGRGQIAMHGWADDSVMGTSASNGCVRMRNADIVHLSEMAPLGTPVEIIA